MASTEVFIGQNVEILIKYRQFLSQIALDDRRAFQQAISQAQTLLGLSQSEIGDWFDLSRVTVNRWANGAAAPLPGLRKIVFDRLARRAGELQRRQQKELNGFAGKVCPESKAAANPKAEPCLIDFPTKKYSSKRRHAGQRSELREAG